MSTKFILLNFYTEGPHSDTGDPQGEISKQFEKAASPFFDKYISYCPRTLMEEGQGGEFSFRDYTQWLAKHPRAHELGHFKEEWAKVGFHAWKAFIIKTVMMRKDVRDGDIIIYHDINFQSYPNYLKHIDEWKETGERILQELDCDIFAPAGLPLYVDSKAYAIRKYLKNSLRFAPGVWNGLIVLRKSRSSIKFIDEWLSMCSDLSIVSPLPNPRPYPGTIWHSIDQSLMGILAAKWRDTGLLPADWPRYHEGDRSFGTVMLDQTLARPGKLKRLMMLLDCTFALRKKYQRINRNNP